MKSKWVFTTIQDCLDHFERAGDYHRREAFKKKEGFPHSSEWALYWRGRADMAEWFANHAHRLGKIQARRLMEFERASARKKKESPK